MSVSIENFIKVVYKQSQLPIKETRLGTLAKLQNISNAAATDMARKLALKGFVKYQKYKPLELTKSGRELALKVLRKHRLWESFLYQTLKLSLHEIHCEAENLEHQTSDFLADKIEEYLKYPSIDPHGDPIPTLNGKVEVNDIQLALSQTQTGYEYKIQRLNSSDKGVLDFCEENKIEIGETIYVQRQFESSRMTEILINQKNMLLNEMFTQIIFVKQLSD